MRTFLVKILSTSTSSHQEFQQLSKQAIALAQVKSSPASKIADMVHRGSILVLHSNQTAMTLTGEKAQDAYESYRATLDRITFTPAVANNIEKIEHLTQGQKSLDYHVRHGDVTTSYRAEDRPWVNKFIPCEFFIQHFEKNGRHQNAKALLFGDFKPSLDWLCDQCPNLILIADVINLQELGSLQCDFLELYAMSRAETIVGPRSSGFSQLAASLGGVNFRDIMKDMGLSDYDLAFAKLYAHINDDPESFFSFGETTQCLAHLVPYLIKNNESRKAADLLAKEIEPGNQIAYLFALWADACIQIGDLDVVMEIRERSLRVPMFDASAIGTLMHWLRKLPFLKTINQKHYASCP